MLQKTKELAYDANEIPVGLAVVQDIGSNHGLQRQLKVRRDTVFQCLLIFPNN